MTTRYLPLLERLDAWHEAAERTHPETIPCRRGCTACCHGPFDISVADIVTLLEGVANLAIDQRAGALERAGIQMEAAARIAPDWVAPFDVAAIGEARFDQVSDELAALPCPLLGDDGGCLVYRHRPMVCRIMGLGLRAESGDVIENGCPIQTDFPGYAALPPMPFPLEAWEAEEESAKEVAARQLLGSGAASGFETTIAAALVVWAADRPPAPDIG
ncbi:MAG: YkgJ family cysteine cluster protein [Gemmatimonadales bacterium]